MIRIRSLSGEMAGRIADLSWDETPLGPLEHWPQNLVTALSILLGSRFPMQLLWGPAYTHFYNDAYLPIAADKHPAALGMPGAEIWPEVWETVRPMLDGVRATGHATWAADLQLMLSRNGRIEEGYFTFSYGPVWGDQGGVDGIFIAVTETTPRVIAERRLHTGRDLSAALIGLRDEGELCRRAGEVLAQAHSDIPFTLIFLGGRAGAPLRLVCATGLEEGHPAAPPSASVEGGPWPFAEAQATERPALVTELPEAWGPLPGGPWDAPAAAALVLPLRDIGGLAPLGYLVAGLSPRLPLDDDYRQFLERVAAQIAGQVAGARAYAAAQAAVQLRDDFLSVAAHELKNPLTPLLGRLQLVERRLQREGVDQRHIDSVAVARGEAQRLVVMLDTLLDISRLRGGQLRIERDRVDLVALARQAVGRLAPSLAQHTLALHLPELPVAVDGDAMRLEQVLHNLLGNAVKYSPRGGEIVVAVRAEDGDAALTVSDHGVGIPEEARPKLFERYYRAGNADDHPTGGLGIGLFVVGEIVRLHGGRVVVESALGVGSSFTVRLPLAEP